MNKNMLAAAMVAHGETQNDLANALGISMSRLNAKINGSGGADFWCKEVQQIADRYGMKPKDIYDIFFAGKVSGKTQIGG